MESSLREFRPSFAPVPAELASTARENLPMFQITHRLAPIRQADYLLIEAYLGSDYASQSPDVFIMPRDLRVLCILAPGTVVFLSDDITHHYATVDDIDTVNGTITLLDPLASVSFLLPGRNFLGVHAKPLLTVDKLPRLKLSNDEFLRVLRGFLESSDPEVMLTLIQKVYPELTNSEDYLFWKYSRIIGSGQYGAMIAAMIDLSARDDLSSKPRLKLLLDFAGDMTGIVTTGVPVALKDSGNGHDSQELNEFLDRAEAYGRLPWLLRWLLVDRSARSGDRFLLQVLDRLLKANPQDIDLRIERAEVLIRLGRPLEALQETDEAARQWKIEVSSLVRTNSPDKLIALVFEKEIGLISLDAFKWRYTRITLAQLTAKLLTAPGTDISEPLNALTQLDADSELLFLSRFLHLYGLMGDRSKEEALIDEAVLEAQENEEADTGNHIAASKFSVKHLAEALYAHFTADRVIDPARPGDRDVLETTTLRREICHLAEIRYLQEQSNEHAAGELNLICQASASGKRTRPNLAPADDRHSGGKMTHKQLPNNSYGWTLESPP